jgi:hypothetical protein
MLGNRPLSPPALLLSLLLWVEPVSAQFVDDPVLPRGSVSLDVRPASHAITGLYGGSGIRSALGSAFFLPEIGSAQAPQLEAAELRLQELSGSAQPARLILGSTTGRMSMDRQVVSFGLSYGLLDRVTLGVTVPVVRTRLDAMLRLTPDGANVGTNPSSDAPAEVSAFLGAAGSAMGQLQTEVGARCEDLGEDHPDCLQGQALAREAGEFLSDLGSAYEGEALFPLSGSTLGVAVRGRWDGLIQRMAEWNTAAPEDLPLATAPLDDPAFRALVVRPAWPGSGFPVDEAPALVALGDVEAHVALTLLSPSTPESGRLGSRVRSSLVGTVRLGTGDPDSLRTVAPLNPPQGVHGLEVRWITDVLLTHRLAFLGEISGGWHGSQDIVVLAPDRDRPFVQGATRAPFRWQPGSRLGASLYPRLLLGDLLSIGGGWSGSVRQADAYDPIGSESFAPPGPGEATTTHRVGLELRFVARDAALSNRVPFAFELLLRGSRTVSGGGAWSPVDRRIEASVRVLRGG